MDRFKHLTQSDLEQLVRTLIAGEILTNRAEPGPLARLWHVRGRRRTAQEPAPPSDDSPDQSKKP